MPCWTRQPWPHNLNQTVSGKAGAVHLALKAVGFKISIDDFGTGFSNLAQLSKLPYDCLKIDRSLVRDIASTHETR
ncbi:EAL domain-containing protein [Rhizobium sp. AAP43]|uniref:EAL domain-containing protein n=1 Tax=Rhizobium sp. AAP43 TaxID=1523420 RepID=UPI0009E85A4D|nr:EAL domain-containing protein [Rhizobium sp. AAP43]